MASSEQHGRQANNDDTASELWSLLARVEAVVHGTIVSTEAAPGDAPERAASASEAVREAERLAYEGRRVSVMLTPDELFGALEAIHHAARGRAPLVVHVVGGGRALSPGHDEIAPALELGAGVLVTWSPQESVDLTLAAHRAAEDSETPWIVFSDAPVGDAASIVFPEEAVAQKLLGPHEREPRVRTREEEDEGSLLLLQKRRERSFAARAPFALSSALRDLSELTGRPLAPFERYETTDAEEILVAVGQAYTVARAVAASMRQSGRRVGAVGVRALRPFFAAEMVKALARARSIAVLEPLDVALAPAGPLATSIKAAFADALTWAPGFPGVGRIPTVVSAVFATLDGGVSESDVRAVLDELYVGDRARRVVVFGSDQD